MMDKDKAHNLTLRLLMSYIYMELLVKPEMLTSYIYMDTLPASWQSVYTQM